MRVFAALLAGSHLVCSACAQQAQIPLTTPELGFDAGIGLNVSALESYIEEQRRQWHVPGMAVAVIDGDATWSKGFGWARINETEATPETLFYGGSTTKSFTAAAMSLLVDNDDDYPDVKWETPVSSLLREDFVLSDAWATEHIMIRDALSHRTGYPPHDAVALEDPREATRALRHLPMASEPRTTFEYTNLMFTMTGYLVEKLTGRWLGSVLKDWLWRPMGMDHTFLSLDDALSSDAVLADEYWYHNDSDSYVTVPHSPHSGHEGAGMIISNVLDYARYLRYMMTETGPISKAGHQAVKWPHTVMAGPGPIFQGPLYYGHGWVGGVLEGQEFWFHNGQMREHLTELWMFPEKQFGIVVMTNAQGPGIQTVLWHIIYEYFKTDEKRRRDVGGSWKETLKEKQRAMNECPSRLFPSTPDSPMPRPVSLDKYAKTFQSTGYGTLETSLECDDEPLTDGTPAHPTMENGCYLKATSPPLEYEGKGIDLLFEHITGDYWIAWMYVREWAAPSSEYAQRPVKCLWTQFGVDETGEVKSMGIDLMWRESGGEDLVWYDAV